MRKITVGGPRTKINCVFDKVVTTKRLNSIKSTETNKYSKLTI